MPNVQAKFKSWILAPMVRHTHARVPLLQTWSIGKKSHELGTRFNLTSSSSQKGQSFDIRISWEPTVGWNFLKFPRNVSLLQALFLLFEWLLAPTSERTMAMNQFLRLKLPHTSYFSFSNQAEKGRGFYLVDNCFETGGDSRNFCDE